MTTYLQLIYNVAHRFRLASYQRVLNDIENDYKRKAITRGERDELREAVENADSEREAQKVVEQHRKMRASAADPKSTVKKLLTDAEKDLKSFASKLPGGYTPQILTKTESKPGRGGYGPYETGTLYLNGGEKRITVVFDLPNGTLGIGAYSNNHPLNSLRHSGDPKEAPEHLKKVLKFFKESIQAAAEKASKNTETQDTRSAWSVVRMHDGYAEGVDVYDSKEKAEREAKSQGNCYVVKGTQMWNKHLGRVEEHDKEAPYKFFR